MDREVAKKPCRHGYCKTGHNAPGMGYQTNSALGKHERKVHECKGRNKECLLCNVNLASLLQKTQAPNTNTINSLSRFHCRHLGCQRHYASESNRITHELHSAHSCFGTCGRCLEMQNNERIARLLKEKGHQLEFFFIKQ